MNYMSTDEDNVGNDNVIIGPRKVKGNRNVIIYATDVNGNTILNRPMVIGYNAKGGPNDIVIGSGAGVGSELFLLLNQLQNIATNNDDPKTVQEISDLIIELKKPQKDKRKIMGIWNSLKAMAMINGATNLIWRVTEMIQQTLS